MGSQQGEQHQQQSGVIQGRRGGQREEAKIAAHGDGQPVVATILFEADEQVIKHLCKSQRDHDEGNACGAQRNQAREGAHCGANQHRHGQLYPATAHPMVRQQTCRVSTQPEVQRMAKAHHAAIAQHQVEAASSQREHQHPAAKGQGKGLCSELRVNRQCQQQQHNHGPGPGGNRVAPHRFLTGNRPSGLSASTAAMKMQISIEASAGPAACAVLRSRNSRSNIGKKARPAVSISPTSRAA